MSQSENYADTSFAIALAELKKARDTHREFGRNIKLRCFFLEKDASAHQKLAEYADKAAEPGLEIRTLNKPLEEAIGEIAAFCAAGGSSNFSFIFIDPKGWTGFAMKTIQPLLRLNPGEVLINFMTSFVRRFVNMEESAASFDQLFGSSKVRDAVGNLSGADREDILISAYTERLKDAGNFKHAASAIVLHPQRDQTHFHLIYATRDDKGLEVFKNAEKKAMPFMENLRGAAQKRTRERRTGQSELFEEEELPASAYFRKLRTRYTLEAKAKVRDLLQARGRMFYDDLWRIALVFPMTWESDLKEWIVDWRKENLLRLQGMPAKARGPRRDSNVAVIWLGIKT